MALVTRSTVFIHIQKTAGMSVRHAMHRLPGPVFESGPIESERHIGLPELCVTHPGLVDNRIVFGFVRHPVSWLKSRWAFAMESGFDIQRRHRPAAASLWIADCWAPRLETFVDHYLERHAGCMSRIAFHMLGLWSDRPADFVGRAETLGTDLACALIKAGEDPALLGAIGRDNQTPRRALVLDSVRTAQIEAAELPLMERFYLGKRMAA